MFIAAAIGAVAFLPSIVLNIALACGAPWGAYAMNAQHKVIPPELRKAFIVPTCLQFVALFVLNFIGSWIDVELEMNLINCLITGVFGVPGVILLLVVKYIL